MNADPHATFQNIIDKTLAGSVSPRVSCDEEQSLREHLSACAQCQDYLSASTRVIDSLGGFSFEVDPGLQRQVFLSLQQRAQQLQSAQPSRTRILWGCIAALVLLVAGSYIASQFGNLTAASFNLQHMQVQRVWLALWVIPSMFFALLIPALPLLSNRKERVL